MVDDDANFCVSCGCSSFTQETQYSADNSYYTSNKEASGNSLTQMPMPIFRTGRRWINIASTIVIGIYIAAILYSLITLGGMRATIDGFRLFDDSIFDNLKDEYTALAITAVIRDIGIETFVFAVAQVFLGIARHIADIRDDVEEIKNRSQNQNK